MDIGQLLPKDVYDANVGANAPSSANVYATMADVGGGSSNTIYTADDTVLTNRTATVTDTLTWSGGRTIRNGNKMSTIINGVKIIEICALADFPTPVANVITLEADTTYLIIGVVDILDNRLDVQADNVAIVGNDRNKDILKASTLTGVMITVGADVATIPTNTEYNFTLDNIGLQAPLGKILEASNIDKRVARGSVFGRTKVLQISNCEIRDTKDIWTIVGFELVDLLNNLIWFITGDAASPIGCQFKSVRHLEISSCEVFNWSNATANVTNMIELLDDYQASGIPLGNFGTLIPAPGPVPGPPTPPWFTAGTTTDGTGLVSGFTMTGGTSGATADVSVWILLGVIQVSIDLVNSQSFIVGETVSIPAYTCGGCGDSEWTAPLECIIVAEDFIDMSQFNAVVNINGCIIHPEYNQVGLLLNPLSTTKFGTISSNTFISANLNAAGSLFLPELVTPAGIVPDYSVPESITYDIFTNQGIINSVSGVCTTLQGNTTTQSLTTTPVQVSVGSSAAVIQAANRFSVTSDGTMEYIANKQIYVSIHVSLSVTRISGGDLSFYFYKDSGSGYIELPGSENFVETTNQVASTGASIVYGTLLNQNDKIQLWVSDAASGSCVVTAYQIVIRE